MAGVRFANSNSATNVGGVTPDPLANSPGGSLPRENFGVGFNPNSDALFGDSGQLFREERNEDRPAPASSVAQSVPPAENYFDTVDPDLDTLYGSGSQQPVRFSNAGSGDAPRQTSKGSFVSNKPDYKKPLLSTQKPLGERLGSTTGKLQALGALRSEDGSGAKEQLRQEVRGEAKKALKNVVEKGAQKVTKQATKEVVETGAKVAVKGTVRVAEAAVDIGTAGLGIIINVFVEIALRLGFDDAFDGVAALAQVPPDITKARKLLVQAGMKVIIGLSVILIAISCFTIVGIIPALPALIFLHIYWFLGFVFPGSGWFNGFLKWELLVLIIVDVFVFIVFALVAAALLYYACNLSGLNTSLGQVAASAASAVGISDLAGQLGAVCASFPK
jgi:hypothetical protein